MRYDGLMVVVVPTRGRPDNMVDFIRSWEETTFMADLVFAVDDDDPRLEEYMSSFETHKTDSMSLVVGPRLRLGGTLNKVSSSLKDEYSFVGFMGDDHRTRTQNWDIQVYDAFKALPKCSGFVYGNDLNWGEGLPTSVFISSDILATLGFMVPPGMIHLYFDNFWLDFGRALGRITYLPDVVIEHMHPSVGKATEDAGYVEVNAPEMYDHDRTAYEAYCAGKFQEDLKRCV